MMMMMKEEILLRGVRDRLLECRCWCCICPGARVEDLIINKLFPSFPSPSNIRRERRPRDGFIVSLVWSGASRFRTRMA